MKNKQMPSIRKLLPMEWEIILQLSVSKEQKDFIETSARCLADAKSNAYSMSWNFYGIFLEQELIGFAMYAVERFKFLPLSRMWLDRFMIDSRFQGKGYGKAALRLILSTLQKDYSCNRIYLSVFEGNYGAIELYKKLGFKKTWFKEPTGERIMVWRS